MCFPHAFYTVLRILFIKQLPGTGMNQKTFKVLIDHSLLADPLGLQSHSKVNSLEENDTRLGTKAGMLG